MKSSSVTSSDSNRADGPDADLAGRAARAFDLLAGHHETLGLAVSGGSDSLALLVLAADWARARGRRIEAATVDHGLRPEARGEAERVGAVCEALGVAHVIQTWRRERAAGAPGQAEARQARHRLLAEWGRARDIGVIALGHTRDDRIETFLMRARQGSGWHGLAGPMPLGPSPVWPEGRGISLVRPLLAFGREELRDGLRARGLEWIDDPSNAAMKFERVRARELAGRLGDEGRARVIRIMDAAAQLRAAALAEARGALDRCRQFDGVLEIPLEAAGKISADARVRLVEALVMAAGHGQTPPRREALERVAAASGPTVGMTLAGAWIQRKAGALAVSQAPPRRGADLLPPPAWDRGHALLCDPALEALAAAAPVPPVSGEKDAGK